MEERFLAYEVFITTASVNMEEMLLGMFVGFAHCDLIFVPHELQVIEAGGINVRRNHLAELLRHTEGDKCLRRDPIVAHNDALDVRQQISGYS